MIGGHERRTTRQPAPPPARCAAGRAGAGSPTRAARAAPCGTRTGDACTPAISGRRSTLWYTNRRCLHTCHIRHAQHLVVHEQEMLANLPYQAGAAPCGTRTGDACTPAISGTRSTLWYTNRRCLHTCHIRQAQHLVVHEQEMLAHLPYQAGAAPCGTRTADACTPAISGTRSTLWYTNRRCLHTCHIRQAQHLVVHEQEMLAHLPYQASVRCVAHLPYQVRVRCVAHLPYQVRVRCVAHLPY